MTTASQRKYIRIDPNSTKEQMIANIDKNFQVIWQAAINNGVAVNDLQQKNNSTRTTVEMEHVDEDNLADAQIFGLMVGNCTS
jgi:hypothetical protein